MQIRTMISMEPELLEALKSRARAERVSLAELIRRLAKRYLAEPHPLPPIPPGAYDRIVGLGSSGEHDVSVHHDTYLADAVRRDHAR